MTTPAALDIECPACKAPPGTACDAKGRLHDVRRRKSEELAYVRPLEADDIHATLEMLEQTFPGMMAALGQALAPETCSICQLRVGIGACTQCVIRAMRDASIPDLDKWVGHVINALEGHPTMPPGSLVAWVKGYHVDLDPSAANPGRP